MTAAAPTPLQVVARVRAVREKDPEARFIGLRARPEWSGPATLRVGDRDVPVVACPSPLALREALVAHASAEGPVVLLVDRDESDLGLDVLARLAKRRLLDLDPWALVLELFRAREWDRQLAKQRWLADALLEGAGAEGYPPVATGVLDAETVWRHVLTRRLGFASPDPDLGTLLMWAQGNAHRLAVLPDEARVALTERLVRSAGPAAVAVVACMGKNQGHEAVPVGLVLRVLSDVDRDHVPALRDAWVRLEESVLGGRRLDHGDALEWSAAAEGLARRTLAGAEGRQAVTGWLDRAEALLQRLGVRDQAWRSALLPSGLAQRLARWGEQLGTVLRETPPASTRDLEDAAQAVLDHDLARQGEARTLPVSMSLRLVRWLAEEERAPRSADSLVSAAQRYHAEGGLVDWARASVWDEGAAPVLRQAYATLVARVDALRHEEDRRFGTLLASWVSSAGDTAGALPIEQVLAHVVTPLAGAAPVLLVVLDGMSLAVFRELEENLLRIGWSEVARAEGGPFPPVIAAFPTVTAVCRTSLLTGALRRGVDQDEAAGFGAHAALRAISGPRRPPVLFHKGELLGRGASGLSEVVLGAIDDPAQRVVGVVVNAVDDHLMKGDQVRVAWRVDTITPLDALLNRARDAGRAVVLTSDHGHVVERGSDYRNHEGADERWRADDGREGKDEVLLRGPRVVGSGAPGQAIRAPWSERVRYSAGKRHGYHGGASPAEVVVPLGIFTPVSPPAGWRDATVARPAWWTGADRKPTSVAAPTPVPPVQDAGPLFRGATTPPAAVGGVSAAGSPWIERLLTSSAFKAQLDRAARGAPDPALVRRVLEALSERGGKLTTEALAVRAAIPAFRVPTTLAALRRLLNVDGYAVLTLDEGSQTVALDRALLMTQFGLEG